MEKKLTIIFTTEDWATNGDDELEIDKEVPE